MKPSEKRALEAEKRAQKEAEQRERDLGAKSGDQKSGTEQKRKDDAGRFNTNSEYKKPPKEKIAVHGDENHKESFFGNHVKLITFSICAVLILTVAGPFGIDRLVDRVRENTRGKEMDSKTELTIDEMKLLADLGDNLAWDSLANFNYVDYSSTKNGVSTHIREYPVKGTDLVLRVGGTEVGEAHEFKFPGTNIVIFRLGDTELPAVPEYVRLIDYKSGDFVEDIRDGDILAFLDEHT